jgi:thioredoxin-like negative regulator of GroEL
LKADYRHRADAVERAIEDGKARFAAVKVRRSPARVALTVAAVAAVAILAGVLVARSSGRREVTTAAGSDVRQTLSNCFQLGTSGALLDASKCYGQVLQQDPKNPEALAYLGWFLYLAGKQSGEQQLLTDGPGFVDRSIAADPTYPDARAFKAVILTDEGDVDGALAQLATLDTLHPSALITSLVAPLKAQLAASTTTSSVG